MQPIGLAGFRVIGELGFLFLTLTRVLVTKTAKEGSPNLKGTRQAPERMDPTTLISNPQAPKYVLLETIETRRGVAGRGVGHYTSFYILLGPYLLLLNPKT